MKEEEMRFLRLSAEQLANGKIVTPLYYSSNDNIALKDDGKTDCL